MFKIRREQTEVLRREAHQRFEDNAVLHLRTQLTDLTKSFSDEELRRRIRECIPRSRQYGLTTEQQVICFIDTTFLLNKKFDSDPAHAWTTKVLRNEKLGSGEKASVLLYSAIDIHNRRIGSKVGR